MTTSMPISKRIITLPATKDDEIKIFFGIHIKNNDSERVTPLVHSALREYIDESEFLYEQDIHSLRDKVDSDLRDRFERFKSCPFIASNGVEVSWCANNNIDFQFSDALNFLENGCLVKREGWDEGVFLQIREFAESQDDENPEFNRMICEITPETGTKNQEWKPTQEDILADDWILIEDSR